MNDTRKRQRREFRPSLAEASLEQRVVLDAGALNVRQLLSQLSSISASASAGVSAARARGTLNARNLQRAYLREVIAARRELLTFVNKEAAQLYASGTPTQEQVTDFYDRVAGAVNAVAFRLSSQAALLPRAGRVLPSVQNDLLGVNRGSLMGSLQRLALTGGSLGSAGQLQRQLGQIIDRSLIGARASSLTGGSAGSQGIQRTTRLSPRVLLDSVNASGTVGGGVSSSVAGALTGYFNRTDLARRSVDAFGNRIGLQQFLGGQVVNQFANTLGSLASSLPNVASTALFSSGTTTVDPTAQAAFNQQVAGALGTAAFQLAGNLRLFPNAVTDVVPQLQSSLFGVSSTSLGGGVGTGTGVGVGTGATGNTALTSLFSTIQGLPTTSSTAFSTAASSAFSSGFGALVSPLSSFFGLPTNSALSLPTSNFSSVLGTAFQGLGNGFNSGFGSGFIGFGTPLTGLTGSGFGTGFNNLVSTFNTGVGFNLPAIGGSIPGTPLNPAGGSTTIGVGTGSGILAPAPGTSIPTPPGGGTINF